MTLPFSTNPALRTLPVYQPGRPIEEVARELGLPADDIIKLASNENPLGPSPLALAAMRKALVKANLYPDGNAYYLKQKLAAKLGLTPANLILGNGSNEVIEFIGHALLSPSAQVVVSQYCFAVYPIVTALFGARLIEVPARNHGHHLDAMLAAITPNTRVVFVANPNNPTGTAVSPEALGHFVSAVPENVVLALDEAYIEFLDGALDLVGEIRAGRRPNLLLMRTFSKIYGLAGLRLGYGIGHPELISELEKIRQPFNINSIAQAGALAALEDTSHVEKTRQNNFRGLKLYAKTFRKLGLEFIPSSANFILVRVGDGQRVFGELQKLGVIVRPMGGYQLPEWVRISVGRPSENARCLEALKQVLGSDFDNRSSHVKLTDLRGILQYIPQFREKTFIISVDGAVVTDENFANILMDIAVLRSLNIRVVLVHGASAQIKALADEQGLTPSNLDGSGITDEATHSLALTAANRLSHEILEGLSANDLRAASTNAIIAHPLGILHGVDHRLTGKVERVDVELCQKLLDNGIIPVLPPLGFDGDGKTYRVNSDAVAVAAAEALKAVKLIFIGTQDGIRVGEHVIRQMPVADLESVLAMQRSDIRPDQLSKAIHAVAACKAGIPRVHVINGAVEEGLLAEVFTNEGVGTLIYGNEFQQIRRALKKDIRSILNLTKPSVASEELVKRTRSTLEKQLSDYYIFEIDKNPVGCVALHTYPEQGKGELACLYVSSAHENQGIGRKLIQYVETKAREQGLNELIALSTQAFTYFQSKGGFVEGTPDDLPAARREKYDQSGRHSKVLVKRLR